MKVIRGNSGSLQPSSQPIFEGDVSTRTLVDDKIGEQIRLTVVHFEPNARTRLHTHTCEQVLYILDGRGILATEQEEHEVSPGDAIVVSPGEKHWHGGGPDTAMTHLSILTQGQTEIVS